MRIEDSFVVAAPPDRVWRFITDPNEVGPCIPGCAAIEVTSGTALCAVLVMARLVRQAPGVVESSRSPARAVPKSATTRNSPISPNDSRIRWRDRSSSSIKTTRFMRDAAGESRRTLRFPGSESSANRRTRG